MEVRVNWRSQAETLIDVPNKGHYASKSRPKRFLVATGGEYHSTGGRRSIILRGATVLPSEDGGRTALMWLLAAGIPREAQVVAMAASTAKAQQGEFEVQAVRLWQRTLLLPPHDPLTRFDLGMVNQFRMALIELQKLAFQKRKPHRLTGAWMTGNNGEIRHIECLDADHPERLKDEKPCSGEEVLLVSGGPRPMVLRGQLGGTRWTVEMTQGHPGMIALPEYVEARSGQTLVWSSGACWKPHGVLDQEERGPVLGALNREVVSKFQAAAQGLLRATLARPPATPAIKNSKSQGRRRLHARLIALHTDQRNEHNKRVNPIAPFNLRSVDCQMAEFAKQFSDSESPSDSENEAEGVDSGQDSDDSVDVSQEGVNEEYMWQLAEQPQFAPFESRGLTFVESALALPASSTCIECEREGVSFSKSQQSRHPDERRCKDCIAKGNAPVPPTPSAASSKTTAGTPAKAPASGSGQASSPAPVPQVTKCCACGVPLTKENCSPSQKSKVAGRRKCKACVSASNTLTVTQ